MPTKPDTVNQAALAELATLVSDPAALWQRIAAPGPIRDALLAMVEPG